MSNRLSPFVVPVLLVIVLAPRARSVETAWTVDKPGVSVVQQVTVGKSSMSAPLGWMIVEVSGTFTATAPVAGVQSGAMLLLPTDHNNTEIPALAEGMRFGLIALGELQPNGKPSYSVLLPAMKKGKLTIKLAGGANVSVAKLSDTGPEEITFDKGTLSLVMAFMVPLPKEPKCKLDLHVGGADPLALPEFPTSVAQAAPPLPRAMEPLAKRAFAAKKMFFVWCDNPVCKPSELQLRILANPDVKREDLLLGDEDVATVTRFVYTSQGQQVPFSSCGLGRNFHLDASQFTGRIRASIYLIRGTDAVDAQRRPRPPAELEKAKPISNTMEVQLVFDPSK